MNNNIFEHEPPQDISTQVVHLLRQFGLPDETRRALLDIQQLDRQAVLDILRELITSEDDDLSGSAIKSLLGLDAHAAVDWLIPHLTNSRSSLRWYICYVLRSFGDARSVEPLTQVALHDTDSDVRFMAVGALELTGDMRALTALQHIQQHDQGTDYEGRRIDECAGEAIQAILNRSQQAPDQ